MRIHYEDGQVVELPISHERTVLDFVENRQGEASPISVREFQRSDGIAAVINLEGAIAVENGSLSHPDKALRVWFRNLESPLVFPMKGVPSMFGDGKPERPELHFQQYLEKKDEDVWCGKFATSYAFAVCWKNAIAVETRDKVE